MLSASGSQHPVAAAVGAVVACQGRPNRGSKKNRGGRERGSSGTKGEERDVWV